MLAYCCEELALGCLSFMCWVLLPELTEGKVPGVASHRKSPKGTTLKPTPVHFLLGTCSFDTHLTPRRSIFIDEIEGQYEAHVFPAQSVK